MRIVDADALLETLGQWQDHAEKLRPDDVGLMAFNHGVMALAQAVAAQIPTLTLDDLGIVRCRDCKYFVPAKDLTDEYDNPLGADGLCDNADKYTDSNDFCSSGDCGAKMGGK